MAAAIRYSYLPLDVGCDLRVQGISIVVPPDTGAIAYLDRAGREHAARGRREDLLQTLRNAGYRVKEGS